MLYVDIPTMVEFKALAAIRADACVSIYVPTTPLTQHVGAARIEFGNLGKEGLGQLDAAGFDKRRRSALAEHLDDLAEEDAFWALQAHSLAVFVTADAVRAYRLPNRLSPMVQVSDRFHLKPLLRAITFPQRAFVLALAEKDVRLIEVFSDLPPAEIRVKDLPRDAGSATGRASVNDRSASGRIHGSEGQQVLLKQFARQVDAAIRPALAGRHEPLILAATEPLLSIFRSVSAYPGLVGQSIVTSPGELSAGHLAEAARPVLDGVYAGEIAAFRALFEMRSGQGRATTDIAQAARAATFGAIDTLLVDIDNVTPGTIDEESGAIALAETASANSYGVIDEIAGRAMASGATVMGVRASDIPGGGALAAIFRYEF
jgi:hypothetical protein